MAVGTLINKRRYDGHETFEDTLRSTLSGALHAAIWGEQNRTNLRCTVQNKDNQRCSRQGCGARSEAEGRGGIGIEDCIITERSATMKLLKGRRDSVSFVLLDWRPRSSWCDGEV
jgi:hypothetical protein